MKGTLEYYLIKLGIGLISKEEFMNQILKRHEETKKQEEERFEKIINNFPGGDYTDFEIWLEMKKELKKELEQEE